jgi:phosphoribosyl-ATP pyrophosphohydrolase/phosphoribosyl-AMP cyclohydrolase
MLKPETLDWAKGDGLLPAIVQHAFDGRVLMLAYMNRESLQHTLDCGLVTFYSRSRQALWTKGETSGNTLELVSLDSDCDRDCLLVRARPRGPTCHLGTDSCFDTQDRPAPELAFLARLQATIEQRDRERPAGSYTTELLESGTRRIAQKVGEEGVETALAAVAQDREALLNEAADLVYHLMVLLQDRELGLDDLVESLRKRHA